MTHAMTLHALSNFCTPNMVKVMKREEPKWPVNSFSLKSQVWITSRSWTSTCTCSCFSVGTYSCSCCCSWIGTCTSSAPALAPAPAPTPAHVPVPVPQVTPIPPAAPVPHAVPHPLMCLFPDDNVFVLCHSDGTRTSATCTFPCSPIFSQASGTFNSGKWRTFIAAYILHNFLWDFE